MAFPFLVFQRTTFEDMKDDMPDEDQERPLIKVYFANKRVLRAYSTHAMRGADALDLIPHFDVFTTTRLDRLRMIASLLNPMSLFVRLFGRKRAERARPQRTIGSEMRVGSQGLDKELT